MEPWISTILTMKIMLPFVAASMRYEDHLQVCQSGFGEQDPLVNYWKKRWFDIDSRNECSADPKEDCNGDPPIVINNPYKRDC